MTECFASVSLRLELVESVRKEKETENDQGRKIGENWKENFTMH